MLSYYKKIRDIDKQRKQMKVKDFILENMDEASYEGNIGFEEMVKFWKTAKKEDLQKMNKVLSKSKPSFDEFKELIRDIIGTELK